MIPSRNFRQASEEGRVNVSPMIDMVFILLIFFVVTAVFVEDLGFETNTPDANPIKPLETVEILNLEIDQNNRVFFEDEEISVEIIRAKVSQFRAYEPDIPVSVHARATANAGFLVQVLDEVRLGGAYEASVSLLQE